MTQIPDTMFKILDMCTIELQRVQELVQNFLNESTSIINYCQMQWGTMDATTSAKALECFVTTMTAVAENARNFSLQLAVNNPTMKFSKIFNDIRLETLTNNSSSQIPLVMYNSKQKNEITDREWPSLPGQKQQCITAPIKHDKNKAKTVATPRKSTKNPFLTQKIESKSTAASQLNDSIASVNSNKSSNSNNSITSSIKSQVFKWQEKDLSQYMQGSEIKALITHIQDIDKLTFYILDTANSEINQSITELHSMKNLHEYKKMPPKHHIFGIIDEKIIYRAAYVNNDSKLTKKVKLLDVGDVLEVNDGNIFYELPTLYQDLPEQAILCQLYTNGRLETVLRKQLQELLFKTADLIVCSQNDNKLIVKFNEVKKTKSNKDDEIQQPQEKLKNPPKRLSELTPEELEELFEEEECTQNPLKAVLGFVPKDEKRLCRFYDPATGGCFKGINCRQDHEQLSNNPWTKDIEPSVNLLETHAPTKRFLKNTILNVTCTFVNGIDTFYAQINSDNAAQNAPFIWDDDTISDFAIMQKPPKIFDIVIAKYCDELWYRAQIIGSDDVTKTFDVFYMDYGNKSEVHLKELRKCEKSIALHPFKATLFRIANIKDITITLDEQSEGIRLLSNSILNETFNVTVVEHYHDDLIVQFNDPLHINIENRLFENGFVKYVESMTL